MGIKKFILNNIGFKLLSLVLAVIAWIYIVGELNKATPEEKAAIEWLLPYRMTAKYLPVKLNLTGRPKEGYLVLEEGVEIKPEGVMVIGPRSLLNRVSFIKTEPIDINGCAKAFSKNISLLPLAKGLGIKEKFVAVNIPVEKINE